MVVENLPFMVDFPVKTSISVTGISQLAMLTPEASSRRSSADLFLATLLYRVISSFSEKPMIWGVMFSDVHLNFDSQGFL